MGCKFKGKPALAAWLREDRYERLSLAAGLLRDGAQRFAEGNTRRVGLQVRVPANHAPQTDGNNSIAISQVQGGARRSRDYHSCVFLGEYKVREAQDGRML